MVCDRCIMAVEQLARELGCESASVEMGSLTTAYVLEGDQLQKLQEGLQKLGFELSKTEHQKLISQVNSSIVEYVDLLKSRDELLPFSDFLSKRITYHYNYATKIYRQQVGKSIEQALIDHKIGQVKALLQSGDQTLSEIAWQLNYSSVQYLSNQFKKITGQTVSEFRKAN